ncbi:glycosyltransferase [Synechococcus sp. CCY9202]|nr:glycosyltransferase [Synechococcus sp. CCY9202]
MVIPFRNASAWLPQTLASLQSQSGVEGELIAVDDGSSDASAALVQRLWSHHPWPLRLLRLDGVGVSRARNQGWHASQAPLVAFLDADDLMLPGRLADQRALLMAEQQWSHCLCGWVRLDAAGRPLVEVRPWLEGAGFSPAEAFRHKAVLPSAWMLRRQALEAVGGFDPALAHAEDVDLLLRLALAGQRGTWLRRIGCGYRVHAGSASGHVQSQAHSLLWVVDRQLRRLPTTPAAQALAREQRYTTRAWAGWKAWTGGDRPLAQELWSTSLGMSPLSPARTWLHLAENAGRSSRREGVTFTPELLLHDPVWRGLESKLLLRWLRPEPGERLVRRLRADLLKELGEPADGSPWWPPRLRTQLNGEDPLRDLRAQVLSWSARLIGEPESSDSELAQDLAGLLRQWLAVVWPEDRRASQRILEESLAIAPQPQALRALARLERHDHPLGARALEQLAAAAELAAPSRPNAQKPPPPAMPAAAFWEREQGPPDRCLGPHCSACAERLLQDWRQEPLGPTSQRWYPPSQRQADPPFGVHRLSGGRCWIRSPANPWQLTHGLGVANGSGERMAALCRRYPQPWPTCPEPPQSLEPWPVDPPLQLRGRVLAVADLSAENHYHWLVDAVPRLGRALEQLADQGSLHDLTVWHNGGSGPVVRECLVDLLGLRPEQLIDAHHHRHIQAEELLVPDFAGRFAVPAAASVAWWQRTLQPVAPQDGRVLWWWRGSGGWRRPVWGEAEALARFQELMPEQEVEVVDPAGMSLRQQAERIGSAALVVLPHGAGLANLLFARKGCRVLELCSRRYCPPYSHGLVQQLQLDLIRCEQETLTPKLYQGLFYEGPSLEPLRLDPGPVAEAMRQSLPHHHPPDRQSQGGTNTIQEIPKIV